jgi:hypothetical protein
MMEYSLRSRNLQLHSLLPPASKGNSALHSFRRHANLLYVVLKYLEGLQCQSHQQSNYLLL